MQKISKKWKIFVTAIVVLIGSIYGYYKINNRNAFEEMYNSYYNILPLSAIDNMPQVKSIPKKLREQDIVLLEYKEKKSDGNIKLFLIKPEDRKKIIISYSILMEKGDYMEISYSYDMTTHKLINDVDFYGANIPTVEDKAKQTRELLEKYNISKEYLQKKSDELLDTVLTDWKRYSNSSYSKDNMGKLTIEKDEFLK
ncbi:TipC family immunity protein [Gemella sanguinis]|jgi:hypothetical protein|uniref:TipC family immunity protein n=1 Tax=Gemella sanguinis TaxID=84135 RepID=UPI00352CED20